MQSILSNLDLFVTVTPIQSLETLTFLQLPVPQVAPSPPPPPIAAFSDLLFLGLASDSDLAAPIPKLPVESALSKFIADVFPGDLDFSVEDLEEDESRSLQEAKVVDGENDVASQRTSGSEATATNISKARSSSKKGETDEDKFVKQHAVLQFETPELGVFAENGSFFEKEGIRILFEAPEIEGDLFNLKPGLITHCSYDVKESVLSVQNITFECPVEENSVSVDDCSFQDRIQLNRLSFPTLEVDDTTLESFVGLSLEEKIHSCFQTLEPLNSANDNLSTTDKKLDILGVFSDHFVSGHSFGSDLGLADSFPEVDLISLLEIPQNHFLSDQLLVFHEFCILDVDCVHAFEAVFNREVAFKPEAFSMMFDEDTNCTNFNRLIVSPELTLIDDTFKSIPVPVISDREKIRSFYAIITGKLATLQPQPLSALDEIYLAWHILEEDKHASRSYYRQHILQDIVAVSMDFEWDSIGDRDLVSEFLFSDDKPNGSNMEEPKEFISVESISISGGITMEAQSSGKFPQPGKVEQLARNSSERASLLFKSMSQSNDLDFFLNPQKVSVNDKATSPKVPLDRSVAATGQGRKPVTSVGRNEMFNDFSVEDLYDTSTKMEPGKVESKSVPSPNAHRNLLSLPETIILVNTLNVDKEMIVSRRSTYQRILAIEKDGAQVVERDSDLPVDIIINSGTCLVWYSWGNIGRKAATSNEACSSLPMCIENIATNVMTLLSFSFSGCIMVFEGENSFLSSVMEFSDELYAASASLGIAVQLFFSSSSDLTDEIIMSSIRFAARGVYPRMSESEIHGESFLTKFPSVNPLTAHAILSSGGTLLEFLEWSNEKRIHAVEKYHVPNESIALLSALCKYGEREDSRSIMTDCSSSVSSSTDSKNSSLNLACKRKRWTQMDNSLRFDPVEQFSKDMKDLCSAQKPYDPFMSEHPQEFRNPVQCAGNLFPKELDSDVSHGFQTRKEPQMLKRMRKPPEFSFIDGDDETMFKFGMQNVKKGSQISSEDQKGEVIDLTGNSQPGKGFLFSHIDDSIAFLTPELESGAGTKTTTARRLSFGINPQTRLSWRPAKDQRHSFEDIDFGDEVSLQHTNKKKPLEETFQGNEFGGTLKKALMCSTPGKKSPWTMEFLNKVRDRSRLRHQSVPGDTPSTFNSHSGNISKDFKRRSPSILEFFKYQGGSAKPTPERKKPKQSAGSSKAEKPSATGSIQPTWTPLDKRSHQTLAFRTSGGERQAKLVWNDGTPSRRNKFQSQL